MDEDIEFLEIENPPKRSERHIQEPKDIKNDDDNKNDNKNDESKKEMKKKKKSKMSKGAKTFCLIIIFLTLALVLGCGIFYGTRLVKYYRIYNPKPSKNGERVELLANHIIDNTKAFTNDDFTSGLFDGSGTYIYKGKEVDNYIKYNNMLWRIVRINTDGSMVIILDDYINVLPFNNERINYNDSSINKYLNNDFLNLLDKNVLVNNSICSDDVNTLSAITCEVQNTNNYVTLLDVSSYLNTLHKGESYVNDNEEIVWLANISDEKTWHTNGYNVSLSDASEYYEVKPVVRLKSIINYKGGKGTLDEPYIVESNDNKIGSVIEINKDKYIVIGATDNSYKLLSLFKLDKNIKFSNSSTKFNVKEEDNIGYYLNNSYKDSLSYKDFIIESDYYIGEYKDNFDDIKNDTIKAYVAIPNMLDVKLDSSVSDYYLSTGVEKNVVVYGKDIFFNSPKISRGIRTIITVTNDLKLTGKGTMSDPYKVVD